MFDHKPYLQPSGLWAIYGDMVNYIPHPYAYYVRTTWMCIPLYSTQADTNHIVPSPGYAWDIRGYNHMLFPPTQDLI